MVFLEGTYLLGTAEARSNLSQCRFGRISVPENIEGGWQNVVFNNRYLVIQDITKMGTVRLTGTVEDAPLKGLEHHTRPERECFGMGCLRTLKWHSSLTHSRSPKGNGILAGSRPASTDPIRDHVGLLHPPHLRREPKPPLPGHSQDSFYECLSLPPRRVVFITTFGTFEVAIRRFVSMPADRTCLRSVFF